jgi:hypothetical protein
VRRGRAGGVAAACWASDRVGQRKHGAEGLGRLTGWACRRGRRYAEAEAQIGALRAAVAEAGARAERGEAAEAEAREAAEAAAEQVGALGGSRGEAARSRAGTPVHALSWAWSRALLPLPRRPPARGAQAALGAQSLAKLRGRLDRLAERKDQLEAQVGGGGRAN